MSEFDKNPFEEDEKLDPQRNDELINEREKYEQLFFEQVIDEMMESDALDSLIADRFEYIDNQFDFEPSPGYDYLEELYYADYDSQFQEKISDVNDYIDYPDGPNENLNGIIYDEPYQVDFDDEYIELKIELELEKEVSTNIEDMYPEQFEPEDVYEQLVRDALVEFDFKEEEYMENLIKEHIKEEERYLDNILIESILEENLFERAIDELIFDEIDIDYEPDNFDYEGDDYWYDNYNPSDKLLTDPFDSFDEIDYPEGEPSYKYDDEILQRDFEDYQRKHAVRGLGDENIHDCEDDLILEPPEEVFLDYEDLDEQRNVELIKNQEKVESLFKDYFTKDDTLDKIIKEKLKEKKFKK